MLPLICVGLFVAMASGDRIEPTTSGGGHVINPADGGQTFGNSSVDVPSVNATVNLSPTLVNETLGQSITVRPVGGADIELGDLNSTLVGQNTIEGPGMPRYAVPSVRPRVSGNRNSTIMPRTRGSLQLPGCDASLNRSMKAPANEDVVDCMYRCVKQLLDADEELVKRNKEVSSLKSEVSRLSKNVDGIEQNRLYLKIACAAVTVVSGAGMVTIMCLL